MVKPTKGKCSFCGQEVAKSGAGRHLGACAKRREAIAEAENSKRKRETLYHVRVQAEGLPPYWLDLELPSSAKMKDLDHYLREIWLECCGHMSQFSFGGWGGQEISMDKPLGEVLRHGEELTHIYDFGTESVSLIRVIGQREGKPLSLHPVTLMLRNQPPVYPCRECGEPAKWLCMECLIEEETEGTLCDRHLESHPHENYGEPVPLVNSPRVGLCGYTGPAEPPY